MFRIYGKAEKLSGYFHFCASDSGSRLFDELKKQFTNLFRYLIPKILLIQKIKSLEITMI